MNRTVLAFLCAPLPAPALYYVCTIVVQHSGGDLALRSFAMIYLLGLPVAYVVAIAVGVPLYSMSIRYRWESIGWYLVGGCLAGAVVWLCISYLSDMGYDLRTLLCLAFVGAICGLIFRVILRWRPVQARAAND